MRTALWILWLTLCGCSSSSTVGDERPGADAGSGEDAVVEAMADQSIAEAEADAHDDTPWDAESDAGTIRATLALGAQKSCRRMTNGTLQCWGRNQHGELGLGVTGEGTEKSRPTQVGTDSDWNAVSAGGFHVCATRQSGALFCWGMGSSGQLGDGGTSDRSTPVRVGDASDWEMVAAGGYHTCGLRDNGKLWCWGWNSFGELGTGAKGEGTDEPSPRAIAEGQSFRFVASGDYHSCAIHIDGSLWCWGRSAEGQVGVDAGAEATLPVRVGLATDWTAVRGGQYHTCGLRADGSLWCWGANDKGQCAAGGATVVPTPTRVGTDTYVALSTGQGHTCALRSDDHLVCFGLNESGQLGNGETTNAEVPTEVESSWRSVEAGDWHTCGEKTDGKLYCWGWNYFGQLGTGASSEPVTSPVAVVE